MSLSCPNRHTYLLRGFSCMKSFNPRLITRMMDKELSVHTTYRNLEPPFLQLASTMPVMYSPNIDETRTKTAFGRWALPKLKRQIHHEDIFEVMRALNSIHDLVHDPEKGFEAIRIGLIERLSDMMLHERDFIREKICLILYTLAGIEAGKRAIIRRYVILHNLALLLEDKVEAVRHKAHLVVEMICQSPVAAEAFNSADFMILILRLLGGTPAITEEKIQILHLATLKMLLNGDVKITALNHNAMKILMVKMESNNEEVKKAALDCIGLLCHHPAGREAAAAENLGLNLCKMLHHPSMEVKIKVAGALAFASIQSDTRNKLCQKCTVEKLMEIVEYFHSAEAQLMAMKVLSNLSESPAGKALVKKMKGRIKAIFTNNDSEVDRHKKMLVNLLKKKK